MKISDELLYECAGGAAKVWLDTIPEDDFHPSFRFRMKMEKLLWKQQKRVQATTSRHYLRLRRTAMVCVLLLICMQLMGVISLGALLERFVLQMKTVFPYATEFRITSGGGEETAFIPVEFEYLPVGMEEMEREQTDSGLFVMCRDEVGHYFYVEQTHFFENTTSTLYLDTEDAHTKNYVLGGYDVFCVQKEDGCMLVYMKENDHIILSGNIDPLELEKIALSIK